MRPISLLLVTGTIGWLLLAQVADFFPVVPQYVSVILSLGGLAAAFMLYSQPGIVHRPAEADATERVSEPCERTLQNYASNIASSLQGLYGRSCAFVLLAAPTGQATVQYISNLDRTAGAELLERLFNSWREQYPEAVRPHRRRLIDAANDDLVAGGKVSLMPQAPLEIRASKSALGWQVQMLESTHDAVIIWQMDGAGILYWNRAAERLYGYTCAQAQGKVTHTLLRTQPSDAGIDELEKKLARFGVWVGELDHVARNGRRIRVESRLALIAQEDGRWLVLEVNHDVTDSDGAELRSRATALQMSELRSRVG